MKFIKAGDQFGRLTAIRFSHREKGFAYWEFSCECGVAKVLVINNILKGRTKSCGCLRKQVSTKHGLAHHELYGVWENIIQRCTNPNYTYYSNYGGRGITICSKWRESFASFLADVGERPSKDLTLERILNDVGYEPGNTKWATRLEQAHNTRVYTGINQNTLIALANAD